MPPRLSHRQITTVISGLVLGMVVSSMLRTIADDLHGLTTQAWVTTAYPITATIATPLYGKLSDIHGRRPVYLTTIALFTVGSLLCECTTSIYELAAFRAVQGLGSGGLMSLAMTIVADITTPRERGRTRATSWPCSAARVRRPAGGRCVRGPGRAAPDTARTTAVQACALCPAPAHADRNGPDGLTTADA